MNTTTRNSNSELNRQRQRLETLVQPAQRPLGMGQALSALGDRLLSFFTDTQELRIWQSTRNGHQVWFAHDPVTNRTRSFHSEQDVRRWLDNRYYE
ncbi:MULTISPECIES: hypothetical protein [Cyanophyceae]|uniref:hypothetical protein n=1 Tax=Cyanophyceae TaxID=3028117 RepID=UPI00168970B1|nr:MULTISPECIES: hypothetical protein [Cyanophyceae]MBD1915492.1 hypothetical protein [Phormidium sp. FACHB-77]MBD2031802.1 hypothetical protein [Phormidium sp. FACHB-322]MBD2050552.1 hypothetical protein [Leptolyngbya sp. FACHB-60]